MALPLFELAPDLLLPPDDRPLAELVRQFPGPGGEPLVEFTEALRSRFLDT